MQLDYEVVNIHIFTTKKMILKVSIHFLKPFEKDQKMLKSLKLA